MSNRMHSLLAAFHSSLLGMLLALAGWSVAHAQPSETMFTATGKEVVLTPINPGTWTCVGGYPTGTLPPCSQGTKRVIFHDVSNMLVYQDVTGSAAEWLGANNPQHPGTNVTHCWGNLDENYSGQLHCTFVWTVPEKGGRWEGTASATGNPALGILMNNAAAHGRGGQLEGKTLEGHGVSIGLPYSVYVFAVKSQ